MPLDPKYINGLQECLESGLWLPMWDWLQEQHYHVATPEWQFTWVVGRYGLRPNGVRIYDWLSDCVPSGAKNKSTAVKKRERLFVAFPCAGCEGLWLKGDKSPAAAYQRLFKNMYSHTCGWLEWLEETKEVNPEVPRPLAPDYDVNNLSVRWYHYQPNQPIHHMVMTLDANASCNTCCKLWLNYAASYPELWEWAASNDHNHPHLEELYAIHHGEIHADNS